MNSALHDAAERALIRGEAPATALDETLIVEAAAGTGKTTELVHRIVRVLATRRADIHQIVAVTFTEKAAGELKLRVREEVEKARAAATSVEASALDAALRQLENAHITTIHGLCAELLRERPVEVGLDPRFQVLTEMQADRLFGTEFDAWLQTQLANPPEGVRRILRRRAWRSEEEGSVEGLRRAGLDLLDWRDFDGEWTRPPFDRTRRIDELFDELRTASEMLAAPSASYDGLYQSTWPIRHLVSDTLRVEAVSPRDYDNLEALLVALARDRDLTKLRKGKGLQYRPDVSREALWEVIEHARSSLATFDMEANADLAVLLRLDLEGLVAQYSRAKAAAGVVDFLDLLLKARDLLRNSREVRTSFQCRFARIFVDEFQDTDPLQAEILMLLAADDPAVEDWRNVRPVPGKLFLVGDPKQSIYRFRRADLGVYRSVYSRLEDAGALRVTLATSFRGRPNLQRAINAAFANAMTGDAVAQQADYVALEPARAEHPTQPSVVVLPVPEPYGFQKVAAASIERSLPDAVGAFVDWLIKDSGWTIDVGGTQQKITAGNICLLFRRFVGFDGDVTRPYVDALEARAVPHLLVGGRSFHNRSEVEALRAALGAVEHPHDELSVFATLRGPFFGVDDEALLQYRARFGRFHPFHVPQEFAATLLVDESLLPLRPIADALNVLRSLHGPRNRVPIAATVTALFEATRVHVRFALEAGGEQVLANVLRVADLARQFESEGGISFRGFLEELEWQAETGRAEEAPILEDASDGVRLMTVHKAKGLEFPVVILADMTAKLRPASATRYLDSERRLCAIRLAGCAPDDLTRRGLLELERDAAEGVRIAYVAATRARDLLVVPAVGDEEREGWIGVLNSAIYPPVRSRRVPDGGSITFNTRDSVLNRPNGDPATNDTVSPGMHSLGTHDVVWWDPGQLRLGAEPRGGLRYGDLVRKDVTTEVVEAGRAAYSAWSDWRRSAIDRAAMPSMSIQQVTQRGRHEGRAALPDISVVRLRAVASRPRGRRFGTLVHSVLASTPLDARRDVIASICESQGRLIGAPDDEVAAATACVASALTHPLFDRARAAQTLGHCRREVPVSYSDQGVILEGVVDLAFRASDGWTVVDFKTNDDPAAGTAIHKRQIAHYVTAVAQASGSSVNGTLLYL